MPRSHEKTGTDCFVWDWEAVQRGREVRAGFPARVGLPFRRLVGRRKTPRAVRVVLDMEGGYVAVGTERQGSEAVSLYLRSDATGSPEDDGESLEGLYWGLAFLEAGEVILEPFFAGGLDSILCVYLY